MNVPRQIRSVNHIITPLQSALLVPSPDTSFSVGRRRKSLTFAGAHSLTEKTPTRGIK